MDQNVTENIADTLESRLMSEHRELYLKVKYKSIDEYSLPINASSRVVGFGLFSDFYMFCIREMGEELYFIARKQFHKKRYRNIIKCEFTEHNEKKIMLAIEDIYNDYLRAMTGESITVDSTATRKKKEKKKIYSISVPSPKGVGDESVYWSTLKQQLHEKILSYECPYFISDAEKTVRLKEAAARMEECFDLLLEYLTANYLEPDDCLDMLQKYIKEKKVSLADIGDEYSLSRERARQLILKENKRLYVLLKRLIPFGDETVLKHTKEVAALFEEINYDIFGLILYGMSETNQKKQDALFSLFFHPTFNKMLKEKIKPYSKAVESQTNAKAQRRSSSPEMVAKLLWEKCESKICCPSAIMADVSISVNSFEGGYRNPRAEMLKDRLQAFDGGFEIFEYPDIVYLSTENNTYHPDLLIRTSNGKSILAVVIPTFNMALAYNIQRFNELHRFCKNNGYGYMIVNESGRSIFDLKEKGLDDDVVRLLDDCLNTKGEIVWADIKPIKLQYTLTNEDIAAYILQNKLSFLLNPYRIWR